MRVGGGGGGGGGGWVFLENNYALLFYQENNPNAKRSLLNDFVFYSSHPVAPIDMPPWQPVPCVHTGMTLLCQREGYQLGT